MSKVVLPSANKERKDTDQSLQLERYKTNETLAEDRRKAESNADKVIANERLEADEARKSQRKEVDVDRKFEFNSLSGNSSDVASRKTSDQRIQSEREASDTAVRYEREKIDSAIGKERNIKNEIISKLLLKERGQTDLNLGIERKMTDSEVLKSSARLISEVAAHLQTKTALTTRDEFLAIVSHDLKNPIGIIAVSADLLLEEAVEKNFDVETVQSIEIIKRNSETALRLITDMLDMERVSQGKLELNFSEIEPDSLLEEITINFSQLAIEKNIKIVTAYNSDIPQVVCDRDRTLQILGNVFGNALKFTPAGGVIEMSARCHNNFIDFSIRDSGPGIPKDKLDTIFSRFAQLGSDNRSGLGLGLYISKMFTEAHQGKIWVESDQQTGSVFHISLPVSGPESADMH